MMQDTVTIKKLKQGFLLEEAGEQVAGLSSLPDLLAWLRDWTGEAESAPRPATLADVKQLMEHMNAPMGVNGGLAAAERMIEHEEAAGEERLPAGDDGISDRDPPIEKDPHALFEAGPEQEEPNAASWPRSAPIVSADTETRVRESLDQVKPAKPTLPAEPASDLTDNQQRVLDALQLRQLDEPGRFKMSLKEIGEASGVANTSVSSVTRTLQAKGLILIHSSGSVGGPVYYEAPIADEEDAA